MDSLASIERKFNQRSLVQNATSFLNFIISKTSRSMNNKPNTADEFVFHKNDTVGAPGAEEDNYFLEDCFFDTGDLELLSKMNDRRLVIIGRTGSGKTALLKELKRRHSRKVIDLNPHDLALTYISNSDVIRFCESLKVNLNPFYKLLWRHILTVELVSRFIEMYHAEKSQGTMFQRVISWLMEVQYNGADSHIAPEDLKKLKEYLEDWGDTFWIKEDVIAKQVINKFESKVKDSVGLKLGNKAGSINYSQSDLNNLGEEERKEIKDRCQEIVSQTQINDLRNITNLLSQLLNDRQKSFIVIIDKLDEDWVDDLIRYKLVKNLIDEARELFNKIGNAKIILGLRLDLVDRVYEVTRDHGTQKEKVAGSFLHLKWTKDNILEILNRRVEKMVKSRYTKKKIGYRDLLPKNYQGQKIDDFIFSIANKPRDVIAFFNSCINHASNKSIISKNALTASLSAYSRDRLEALADEWYADYPGLIDFAEVLHEEPYSFKVEVLDLKKIEKFFYELMQDQPQKEGPLFKLADQELANSNTDQSIRNRARLLHIFYRVGLIGLKLSSQNKEVWAEDGAKISDRQIKKETSVVINKKYAMAIGAKQKR